MCPLIIHLLHVTLRRNQELLASALNQELLASVLSLFWHVMAVLVAIIASVSGVTRAPVVMKWSSPSPM